MGERNRPKDADQLPRPSGHVAQDEGRDEHSGAPQSRPYLRADHFRTHSHARRRQTLRSTAGQDAGAGSCRHSRRRSGRGECVPAHGRVFGKRRRIQLQPGRCRLVKGLFRSSSATCCFCTSNGCTQNCARSWSEIKPDSYGSCVFCFYRGSSDGRFFLCISNSL